MVYTGEEEKKVIILTSLKHGITKLLVGIGLLTLALAYKIDSDYTQLTIKELRVDEKI